MLSVIMANMANMTVGATPLKRKAKINRPRAFNNNLRICLIGLAIILDNLHILFDLPW